MEYCSDTSMHGFRYLADRNFNWLNKYAEITIID